MEMFAHYALPAAIAAGALGAVILCVVLMLYGFATTAEDEPRFPNRRLFVIRIGHALAATCFAAVVVLIVIASLDERRGSVIAPPPKVTPPSRDDAKLEARIRVLEERLGAVEQRASALVEPPQVIVRSMPPPAPPAVRRPATVRRPTLPERPARPPAEEALPLPPRATAELPQYATAPVETPPPPPATSSQQKGLRAKVASDWEIIKRGFRNAGKDFESGFQEFSRQMKRVFTSNDG